uniref:Sugar transporter SWEET n=1 Tax=Strigamia maritima TaxID=126957 RepID=T1JAX8_STRMM
MFLSDKYFESYVRLPHYDKKMGYSWNLNDFVELTATIATILTFFSGIGICLTIKRKRDTTEVSAFPFLAGVINCSLWLKYGILQRDRTLMTVNSVGLFLQIIYAVFYYWYSSNKSYIKKMFLVTALILFPILLYLKYFATDLIVATQTSGLVACCASIIFCASPLAGLAVVCKTKNAESLPFTLILMTLVMSLLWFLYGVLHDDYFIQVPNVLGACLAAFQLFLFYIFPRHPTTKADTY